MAFKQLLNPLKHGFFAWSLWSHKVLRWLCGLLLVVIFLTNLALVQAPFYLALFLLQTGFYLAALIGLVGSDNLREKLPIKIPLFFCVTNFSIILALFKYLKGERQQSGSRRRDKDLPRTQTDTLKMDLNALTYRINGAIFEFSQALGSGFLEKVYENGMMIELRKKGQASRIENRRCRAPSRQSPLARKRPAGDDVRI